MSSREPPESGHSWRDFIERHGWIEGSAKVFALVAIGAGCMVFAFSNFVERSAYEIKIAELSSKIDQQEAIIRKFGEDFYTNRTKVNSDIKRVELRITSACALPLRYHKDLAKLVRDLDSELSSGLAFKGSGTFAARINDLTNVVSLIERAADFCGKEMGG